MILYGKSLTVTHDPSGGATLTVRLFGEALTVTTCGCTCGIDAGGALTGTLWLEAGYTEVGYNTSSCAV